VVASPDPVRGAVPKAFVTLASGSEATRETALDILRHTREHLSPYQRIRLLEFVPADAGLPKTVSGKIRRVELRAAEAERVARPAADGSAEFAAADFPELRG
jgi:acetyl-CoA synthetase